MAFNMCYAGQAGYTDRETIFGLRGLVSQITEITRPAVPLLKGIINKKIIRFRRDGNRIDHTVYLGNDTFESKYIYTYDESGRRTGPRFYKKREGNLDHSLSFSYGPDGRRRQKQDQWAPDGTLMFYILFGYNRQGHRTGMTWHQPDGSLIRSYKITYDDRGNRTRVESRDSRGKLEFRNISIFNKRGDLITTNTKTRIMVYRYITFDEYGNWTRAFHLQFGLQKHPRYMAVPLFSIHKLERIIYMFN